MVSRPTCLISAAEFVGPSPVPPQVAVWVVFLYTVHVSIRVGKNGLDDVSQSFCSCENTQVRTLAKPRAFISASSPPPPPKAGA